MENIFENCSRLDLLFIRGQIERKGLYMFLPKRFKYNDIIEAYEVYKKVCEALKTEPISLEDLNIGGGK